MASNAGGDTRAVWKEQMCFEVVAPLRQNTLAVLFVCCYGGGADTDCTDAPPVGGRYAGAFFPRDA